MKKVIKKVVAKAPVKKTVAKKPMMKSSGTKKPLRKAQDGTTIQGPLTEEATKRIDRVDTRWGIGPTADGQSYGTTTPNYNKARKNIIAEADLNPKNSKKLSKGKSREVYNKAYQKNNKVLDAARKSDGMKKWSKEDRNAALLSLGVGVGAPIVTLATNNPISRAFKKAWNLEKKNGGVIKKAKGGSVKSKKK